MNQRELQRHSFTLIELMVVIAVVGTLAALVLSGLQAAKRRGQSTVCKSNIRQLGALLVSFVSDHHEYPLFLNYNTKAYPAHEPVWARSLGSIAGLDSIGMGNSAVFECPRGKRPENTPAPLGYDSYGYNVSGVVGKAGESGLGLGGKGGEDAGNPFAPPVREADIAVVSEMIAIGDSFEANLSGTLSDGDGKLGIAFWVTERIPGSLKRSLDRHNRFGNFVFCDGHVDHIKLDRLLMKPDEVQARLWNRDNKGHVERLRIR